MIMNQTYVSKEEFDSMVTQHVIGICILGVFLLLAIVLGVLALVFLSLKVQQLHERIAELESKWYQYEENNKHRIQDEYLANISNYASDHGDRPPSHTSSECVEMRKRSILPEPYHEEVIELKIEKEVVQIYGRKPPISQVLMTAQSFYKEQSNADEVCPIECVQILDKKSNVRLARSTIYSEDWTEATPTSFLVNSSATSFQDVLNHNKGIFTHKNVGPKGGVISVSGIKLEIPAGALSEKKLITIGVTWDKKYMPALSPKQALLSPIVLCQPSNLEFNVSVTVSFPHAAYHVNDDWVTRIIKREGDITSGMSWTPSTADDVTDIHITDSRVQIKLRHFTLYTCVGETKPGKIAAKLMHVVAFTGKLLRCAFFQPRVYVLNSYKDEFQDVEILESKMDASSKIADTTDLIVKDNEKDIVLEMSKLSDEWKLAGDTQETLSFELVWHACHPHCKFVAKPRRTTVTDIICEILAYQYGNENNPAKLKIAQQIENSTDMSPLTTIQENSMEELVNILVVLLDPQNETAAGAGDWRALAEKMGCDNARVRWLSALKRSPTRVLLDRWQEDGRSFADLEQVMVAIDRPDAAEEIRNHLEQTELGDKKTDSSENPYLTFSEL